MRETVGSRGAVGPEETEAESQVGDPEGEEQDWGSRAG